MASDDGPSEEDRRARKRVADEEDIPSGKRRAPSEPMDLGEEVFPISPRPEDMPEFPEVPKNPDLRGARHLDLSKVVRILPVKREHISARFVEYAIQNISEEDRHAYGVRMIDLQQEIVRGGINGLRVVYDFGKVHRKCGYGRVYPRGESVGAGFPKRIRNFFLDVMGLVELDMNNAHYRLALHECNARKLPCDTIADYVNNREECLKEVMEEAAVSRNLAKRMFLKLAFGGGLSIEDDDMEGIEDETELREITFTSRRLALIKMELANLAMHVVQTEKDAVTCARLSEAKKSAAQKEKSANPNASALSHFLQNKERICQRIMDETLLGSMVVLIHDGAAVPTPKTEEERARTIQLCENALREALGIEMRFEFKAPEHTFNMEEAREYVNSLRGPHEVPLGGVSDLLAAQYFVMLVNGPEGKPSERTVIRDGSIVWCYDESTGMWICDEAGIARIVAAQGDDLKWYEQTGKKQRTVRHYSEASAYRKKLMDNLHIAAPDCTGFMKENLRTDRYKLLFSDCILDMKTGVCTEAPNAFNRNVVFVARIARPYRKGEKKIVQELENLIFRDPYGTPAGGDLCDGAKLVRHMLMRALGGDCEMKECLFLMGPRDSSKSLLGTLCKTAMDGFFITFDMDNLLAGRGSTGEAGRANNWLFPLVTARLAYGSEASAATRTAVPTCNSKIFKLVTGGSDEIPLRTLYDNTTQNHSLRSVLVFASNGMPGFDNPDSATISRIRAAQTTTSFVKNPVPGNIYQKAAVPGLAERYTKPEYGEALIALLLAACKSWADEKEPYLASTEEEQTLVGEIAVSVESIIQDAVMERYVITKLEADTVPFTSIAAIVSSYIQANAPAGTVASDNQIGRVLTTLGTASKKVGRSKHRVGIRLT